MPALVLLTAPESALPRMRTETLARFEKKGYETVRRPESTTWAALFEAAMTPNLFSPLRLFLIDDGKALGKLPEKFYSAVEGKDASTVFLICSEKTLKKELGKAFSLCEQVKYEDVPYWPSQRAAWLQKNASKKGCRFDRDAAFQLSEWIEDGEELRSELEKLVKAATGSGNNRISMHLVDELSVDEGGKAMLNLLNAFAECNVPETVEALRMLREDGELIPVLAALQKRVRSALLPARLGSAAAKTLRLSPYQAKTGGKTANRYGVKLLSVMLGELIRLSMSERTGDGEGWNGLERLLLAVESRAR